MLLRFFAPSERTGSHLVVALGVYVMDPIKIKCTIGKLQIRGAVTHYFKDKWVSDSESPDGGYFMPVKKKHKTPRVSIMFTGIVDVDLLVDGVYYYMGNKFIAIDKNTIVNIESDVVSFNVPDSLYLIGSTMREGI